MTQQQPITSLKHFLGGSGAAGAGSDGPLGLSLWAPLAEFFDEEEPIEGISWNLSSTRSVEDLPKYVRAQMTFLFLAFKMQILQRNFFILVPFIK